MYVPWSCLVTFLITRLPAKTYRELRVNIHWEKAMAKMKIICYLYSQSTWITYWRFTELDWKQCYFWRFAFFSQTLSLPPAYEDSGNVIFLLCVSVHKGGLVQSQVQCGGGSPSPRFGLGGGFCLTHRGTPPPHKKKIGGKIFGKKMFFPWRRTPEVRVLRLFRSRMRTFLLG